MPKKKKSSEKEHIFEASRLTPLAVRWKECVKNGEDEEAMELLNEIIKGSTLMFQMFAQHEGYHNTVDLDRLVSAAQNKVVRWLDGWDPKKGKLFSWFGKCAKNAFRSEVIRESELRKRMHSTGDNLEKYHGTEDHGAMTQEKITELNLLFSSMTSRWGSKQEIGCIKFIVESIVADETIKKTIVIRSAGYAWGVSPELAKFFYSWVLVELRKMYYRRIRVPFSEQDLFRQAHAYTHLVDLLEIVTWDQMKQIIAVMGGSRLKIPTLAQIKKLTDDYYLSCEIEESDLDPSSVERIGKKYGKSQRSAQDIFNDMSETLSSDVSGEYSLYDESDGLWS